MIRLPAFVRATTVITNAPGLEETRLSQRRAAQLANGGCVVGQ